MGNRAVVIFTNKNHSQFSPSVHLHWNGGPESVYAFLDELDRRGVRADVAYECARFIQIVGEYFSGPAGKFPEEGPGGAYGLSLGVSNSCVRYYGSGFDLCGESPGDNGVYVVCREGRERRVWRGHGLTREDVGLDTSDLAVIRRDKKYVGIQKMLNELRPVSPTKEVSASS